MFRFCRQTMDYIIYGMWNLNDRLSLTVCKFVCKFKPRLNQNQMEENWIKCMQNKIRHVVRSSILVYSQWCLSLYLMKFIFECPRFLTSSDHLLLVVFVFPVLDLSLDLWQKSILDGQMNVSNVLGLVKSAFQCVLVRSILRAWQVATTTTSTVFTARCYAERGYVTVYCLSVCPFVCP